MKKQTGLWIICAMSILGGMFGNLLGKPIITMKNFKRGTRVELLGIDISTALTNFDYSTQGEGSGNNAVTLEINIEELTKAYSRRAL
nr:hypothetical protein [uncultured Blautia sp.]